MKGIPDSLAVRIRCLPVRDEEKARLTKVARSYAEECGCDLSACSFVATAVWRLWRVRSHEWSVSDLVWVCGAALIGKGVGIAMGRVRLRLLERRLTRGGGLPETAATG